MQKIIVYTCVTGNYDTVHRPTVFPDWADWISFDETDFPQNRYPKINPHELFPDYDYSLWIDGNIDIISDEFWNKVAEMMEKGVLYAGIAHPQRDDVYEESLRILKNDREKLPVLMRSIRHICKEGLPRHSGLNENGIILRRHRDASVIDFDKLWWELYCRLGGRDQISWPLCVWKTALHIDWFLQKGTDMRDSQLVRLSPPPREIVNNY